jgi:hypothetical protein
VTIATKFGFDIDLETGARQGGTNSRPGAHQASDRRRVEAPADRHHRSVLSASR